MYQMGVLGIFTAQTQNFRKYEDSNSHHQQTQAQRSKGLDLFELQTSNHRPSHKERPRI